MTWFKVLHIHALYRESYDIEALMFQWYFDMRDTLQVIVIEDVEKHILSSTTIDD